jgi:hypothetical protein
MSLNEDFSVERGQLFDNILPNPIRLRHVICAGLRVQVYLTALVGAACLALGLPPVEALGLGIMGAAVVSNALVVVFWLLPVASCMYESFVQRRLAPGVLYKVTPAFMASYGVVALLILSALVRGNPFVQAYFHHQGLEGWRLYLAFLVAGSIFAWLARHALMWLDGKNLVHLRSYSRDTASGESNVSR